LGDCLLSEVFENYRSSPNFWATFFHRKSSVQCLTKKIAGLHFGRFVFPRTHPVTLVCVRAVSRKKGVVWIAHARKKVCNSSEQKNRRPAFVGMQPCACFACMQTRDFFHQFDRAWRESRELQKIRPLRETDLKKRGCGTFGVSDGGALSEV
jgi:hypothetical protein